MQPSTKVESTDATPLLQQPSISSKTRLAYILSCIACCCCLNWPFGIAAFVFAVLGANDRSEGNSEEAKRKTRLSIKLAIVGIAVSLIILTIVLSLCLTGTTGICSSTSYSCNCMLWQMDIDCCCSINNGSFCCGFTNCSDCFAKYSPSCTTLF